MQASLDLREKSVAVVSRQPDASWVPGLHHHKANACELAHRREVDAALFIKVVEPKQHRRTRLDFVRKQYLDRRIDEEDAASSVVGDVVVVVVVATTT